MIASPDSRGSIPRLPEEYLFPGQGRSRSFLLALKAQMGELLPKIYSLDLALKSLHDICSPCHHIERQPCGIDHNKSTTEWNEWCEAIQPMAAQQRFQLLAKLNLGPKLVEREATCNHRCSSFWEYNFWFQDSHLMLPNFGGTQVWVAHLHTIGCTPKSPKAPLARKLKYVEITIANLQKWEAKQVTGDVFPKITCCQTLADMSSISCTKTTRKGACCTGIWMETCTGEILLTRTTD